MPKENKYSVHAENGQLLNKFLYALFQKRIDIAFGIIIPLLITLSILHSIWLKPGPFFYRDIAPIIPHPISQQIGFTFFSWANGPNPANINIFPWFPMVVLSALVNSAIVFNYYTILVAFLPGPAMYFSTRKLISLFDPSIPKLLNRIASLLASLIFFLASTNTGLLSEPGISSAYSYALVPVLFTLFVMIINGENVRRNSLLLGVLSLSGITNPIWIISSLIPMIVYFIFKLTSSAKDNFTYLKRAVLAAFSIILFTSLVFVPNFMGFLLGAGGEYSQYSAGTFHNLAITFQLVQSISYSNLLDSMLLGHGNQFIFNLINSDWTFATLLLPFFAFLEVYLRRDRINVFLFVIALIGIFLGKGANPPLGYLYFLIVKYSPPGLVGLTYDVFPFIIITVLAYSILLARFLIQVYEFQSNKFSPKKKGIIQKLLLRIHKLPKNGISILLTAILVAALFSGTINDAIYVNTYFGPQDVPQNYQTIDSVLGGSNSQNPAYKVMWIPSSWEYPGFAGNGMVNWTTPPYVDESPGFPNQFSSIDSLPPIIIPYLPFTDEIGKILSVMQVKYLVLHTDTKYNLSEIIKELNYQKDLKVVFASSPFLVYENTEALAPVLTGNATYVLGDNLTELFAAGIDPLTSGWILDSNSSQIIKYNSMEQGNLILENNNTILTNAYTSISWVGDHTSFAPNYSRITSDYYPNSTGGAISFQQSNVLRVLGSPISVPNQTLKVKVGYDLNNLSGLNLPKNLTIKEFRFGIRIGTCAAPYSAYIYPDDIVNTTNRTGTFELKYNVSVNTSAPVLIYYWLYGSSFEQLSPTYYLGSYGEFPRTTIVNIMGYPFVNGLRGILLNNSSIELRIYAPASSMYRIGIFSMGNSSIAVQNVSFDIKTGDNFSLSSSTAIHLQKGWHNISVKAKSITVFGFLSAISVGNNFSALKELPYIKKNPTELSVETENTSGYLQYGEQYSTLWHSSEGLVVPAYGGLAIGVIGPTTAIMLRYSLQYYVWVGDSFSCISVTALAIVMYFSWRSEMRRKKSEGALD